MNVERHMLYFENKEAFFHGELVIQLEESHDCTGHLFTMTGGSLK